MDSDFRVDIGEVRRNIEVGEVISLYFPLLRKALLIDTRTNATEGPLVRVVAMAESIEARFQSLRKLRPAFEKPESLTVIPWYKYVSSLERLGVWDAIVRRIVATGYSNAVRDCNEALEQLRRLEEKEVREAIAGESYQTLWQCEKPS